MDYAELVHWAADHGYQAIDVMTDQPNAIEIARKAGLEVGAVGSLPALIVADPAAREANVKAAIARIA